MNRNTVPKYFYAGGSKFQFLHTRLRTGCSSLNNNLFLENITESPLCFVDVETLKLLSTSSLYVDYTKAPTWSATIYFTVL